VVRIHEFLSPNSPLPQAGRGQRARSRNVNGRGRTAERLPSWAGRTTYMRVLDFRAYRRPRFAVIGWGINVASLLNLVAMLASGEFGELPKVVRLAPALGFGLAVVFTALAMRGQPQSGAPSR
jgi:hypothetical protein